MSKILITGSKGLIGRNLSTQLIKAGIEVVQFDIDFSTIQEGKGDILDIKRLSDAMLGCDGVVHLAAVSRVIYGEQNPTLCMQTNVDGTNNVLKAAASMSKTPWVLYASSREVYGQPERLPTPSNGEYQPINVYARSKVMAEKSVLKARSSGMQTAIVRYSNVYGDVIDYADRVVPAFCKAAATGNRMRLEGSSNTFDFTHLHDSVWGTELIVQMLQKGEHQLPPLHLTTGSPTTLKELATYANTAGGEKSIIEEAPSRSYDVAKFYGDTDLSYKILGWRAKISITSGVDQLVKDFREHL